MELKTKRAVEIFSAGKWNDDTYTVEDLDEMVRAFNETSRTWKPPLKLGHDENQKILQEDGYPAAGWVGKLYRVGNKLLADFVDIPAKIFNILEAGAYKKVSSEVFWDIDVGSEDGGPLVFSRMLAGVALLGSDMPAVMNLSDIMEWYVKAGTEKKFYATKEKKPSIKKYGFEIEDSTEAPAMEKNAELEKLKKQNEASEAELEELRKYKADKEKASKKTDDEIAELKEQARNAELDRQVAEVGESQDVTPAMKPYIRAILGGEKKEYSIKVGKGDKAETKKYAARGELVADLLKLHAAALKLNTKEESVEGEEIEQGDDEAALDKKIRAYAKEHKCSYGAAMKAVKAEEAASEESEEDDEDGEENDEE